MTSPSSHPLMRSFCVVAAAGVVALLSGCVVAPIEPRPVVVYRAPPVYVDPAPVVIVPGPPRYYSYPVYPRYPSYRFYRHWR